jgi:hypothetical protein
MGSEVNIRESESNFDDEGIWDRQAPTGSLRSSQLERGLRSNQGRLLVQEAEQPKFF